jgi:WD40 repeat protein
LNVFWWNVRTGGLLRRASFPRPSSWVRETALSHGAALFAVATDHGGLTVWKLDTGGSINLKAPVGVRNIVFSTDEKTMATSSGVLEDKALRFWDLASGRITRELVGAWPGEGVPVKVAAFSVDGGRVAAAGGFREGCAVTVWDLRTSRMVWESPDFCDDSGVAFSRNGKALAMVGNLSAVGGRRLRQLDRNRHYVIVWDAWTGKVIWTKAVDWIGPDGGPIGFSPDGGMLALGGWRSRGTSFVRLWRLPEAVSRYTR